MRSPNIDVNHAGKPTWRCKGEVGIVPLVRTMRMPVFELSRLSL